jgi:2-oxoglutarate ferredoxin oxidoreductase subunit alpha
VNSISNDFVINVATVNGSGSQSANNMLVKALFRMGIPVGGKNLFPSNIAGLPTWFSIRANPHGFTSRRFPFDIVVALNEATLKEDVASVRPGGFFLYNSEFRDVVVREDIHSLAIPFRELTDGVSDSVKIRKLLQNVVYVGVLAELLQIDVPTLHGVIEDQFADKPQLIPSNLQALQRGREFAQHHRNQWDFPFQAQQVDRGNHDQILIDGNSAAAMGLIFGGCTFVAWYPITPSTSLVENFESMARVSRQDAEGRKTYAIVQAEDELAAINMVLGAGWAGARAMTATSGPGLSLMAEAAGLSYYAEIPAVIWDVQRVGPSTGLPTRTLQGDVSAAAHLSHGDTQHILLFPCSPTECFEFGQTAFDLAERLQTLVIVLSDLDLGMNFHRTKTFGYPTRDFDRGKVLTPGQLEQMQSFARYKDVDNDGIPYRTLPGTPHPLAAYFTRGTGHDENANYSENGDIFVKNMDRLNRKFTTAKNLIPSPIVDFMPSASIGLIAYGSTDLGVPELRWQLQQKNIETSYLRLRAWPFTSAVETFLGSHETIYVLEQNRDGQMATLLKSAFPQFATRLTSILQFNGLPFEPSVATTAILGKESRHG